MEQPILERTPRSGSGKPDLILPPGRILALEGKIGSGRTTLVRSILGLVTAPDHDIRILGHDPLVEEVLVRTLTAYVGEDLIFPESWSPHTVGTALSLLHPSWDRKAFRIYCENFGLPMNQPARSFHPKMRFSLMIAAALSRDSRLLLIDGAVTRRDEILMEQLPALLKSYIADGTRSVLLTCGSLPDDLEPFMDGVAAMEAGHIGPLHWKGGVEHA